MYTTDYTVIAAKITPTICNLGIGGWTVTKPLAKPETDSAGPSVIVHIQQGSARVTVRWELVDAPQWDLTIDITALPCKWDEEESECYMLAVKIAQRVASLLKHHLR